MHRISMSIEPDHDLFLDSFLCSGSGMKGHTVHCRRPATAPATTHFQWTSDSYLSPSFVIRSSIIIFQLECNEPIKTYVVASEWVTRGGGSQSRKERHNRGETAGGGATEGQRGVTRTHTTSHKWCGCDDVGGSLSWTLPSISIVWQLIRRSSVWKVFKQNQ